MKKITYTFLFSLLVFVGNINAQEDKTALDEDTFTYKKLNTLESEDGSISLSGNNSKKNSNTGYTPSARSSDSGIGETPGTLSISLTGGANYEVPIAVPPGIDGTVPKISISYNSQAGNGLAGFGWNINGVSVISRIPSSKFHDGVVDGVNHNILDRFALDGERLILKSGTYGGDGATYETEKFSNLKISSHGAASSPYGSSFGPSFFVVNYPDGSIARYGESTNSISHTTYAITYWENPQKVRISYEYIKSDNSQSISKIKYGSLDNAASINEIRFNYRDRERLEHSYVNNVSITRKDILQTIESFSSGVRYRSYFLTYSNVGDNVLEYEKLIRISEASGMGTAYHSSINFSYSSSESSVNYSDITTDLGVTNIEQRNSQVVSLDMTGDGKLDFLVYPNGKNKFWLFHSIKNGRFNSSSEINTNGTFEALFPSILLNRQNKVLSGQGLTIVQNSGNEVKFKVYSKASAATGHPIGLDYTKTWNSPTYNYQNSPTSSTVTRIPFEYVSGDFNGDGLTDVLAIGKSYGNRYCAEYPCPGNVNRKICLEPYAARSKNDPFSNHVAMGKKSLNDKGEVSEYFRPAPDPDCDDGGSNSCYSCSNYTENYRGVYFINLRRDISSGFANNAGSLQHGLGSEDKLMTGDFNGDGKTDLYHFTNGKLFVYTLNQNNSLELLWKTPSGMTLTGAIYMGDYNGDGKTDFMIPTNEGSNLFNVFISTGGALVNHIEPQPFTYRKSSIKNGTLSGYNLVPIDVNGDGKTDIVEYNTLTHEKRPFQPQRQPTQTITVYNNLRINNPTLQARIKFINGGTATKRGNLEHFPIPIFMVSNQKNKNLEFASISNSWITHFSFTNDHREDVLLKGIENNGIVYQIEYGNLDPSQFNNEYHTRVYQQDYNQVYPNIDLEIAPTTRLVTALRHYAQLSSGTVISKKVYAYKGAVINAEGLGFLGFSGIAQSNWYTDDSNRIFSVSKYDPSLRGAMVEEYSTADTYSFTTPASNYISKTQYKYSSSLSSNKVFNLRLDSSSNQNSLEGTYTNSTYQYDAYNNPINISTNYMGGSSNKTISYSNSKGSDYYIGRPINAITTSTVGSDSFSTEQQFVYSGHLLVQRKIKGNGTPFDVETYTHDKYGNITKITTTPNGENSREIGFGYDDTGRFITSNIDTDGLVTTYTYKPEYGNWNLSETKNPFGQEMHFKYDAWDRQIKSTDYLGKASTTDYTEDNNAYTVTDTHDDGSGTIVEYDQLQRVSVVKEKDVFGAWISKKHEYDAFNRLIKVSEPYAGSSPSQWNETVYDLYGRPTSQKLYTGRIINISYNKLSTTVNDGVKTVTSTRNQIGTIASVTDPGGTINYSYYGNGSLKSANNNGVIVSAEQDGWGRKKKLIDPSAGTYEYKYNGYGEVTKETNPKGSIEYEYSSVGKLVEKKVTGDNTDMLIQYSYHTTTHKFLKNIAVTSADGNNSIYNYGYDSSARLKELSESNTHASFNTKYTYDDFGRIATEENYAKLALNNKTSTKKIKNSYQYGGLKTIKDFSTNANIWDVVSVNERGQLTSASLGNNINDSRTYNPFGYVTNTSIVAKSTSQVLMKLGTDFNVQKGTLNSRSNSMFSWSETFAYDNLDRLITFTDNDGANNLTYDNFGRITSNNTVGDYSYTGKSYQIKNIDLNNQGDLYYQQNTLEQIKYNAFKKPVEVHGVGKEKIGFQYNAFMERSHMYYGDTENNILDRNNRKHYSHDGSMEISYDKKLDKTVFVTYIGGDAYSAPAIYRSQQGGGVVDNNYYYLHRDYLGSILLITDGDGNAKEKRHFDAWGKTVKVTDGNNKPLDNLTFLDRGYTGHEHLQGVKLIHMNGRLYDPNLKRFLSPDNNIQDITNTQNFNRYGYVLNNPLMYVDPSGEIGEYPGSGLSETQRGGLIVLAASLLSSVNWKGLRMRDVTDWAEKNFGNLKINHWVTGWFKGKSKAPVEYANYDSLSSDPLAGATANTPASFFGGGGIDTGGGGITSGGKNYGGDGSGSFSDYLYRFIFETDQYNPFALVWDGIKGHVNGSDRFGNSLSGFDASLKIVSAIPITKGTSIVTNSVRGAFVSESKMAAKTVTNIVYQGFDKAGVVRYVGITERGAAVRFGEHINSGTARSLLRYDVVSGAKNLSRIEARVWEQGLINEYGLKKNGGLLLNKINSISPKNWWQYGIK